MSYFDRAIWKWRQSNLTGQKRVEKEALLKTSKQQLMKLGYMLEWRLYPAHCLLNELIGIDSKRGLKIFIKNGHSQTFDWNKIEKLVDAIR